MKKEFHFLIYLIVAILLFLGSEENRLTKSQFLSKTLYFPFVNSIQKFNSLFDLKEKNKILNEKRAEQTIRIIQLENKLVEGKQTGLIYQDYMLFPHLSVFDNIAYGLKIRKKDRAVIRRQVEEAAAALEISASESLASYSS